MGFLKDLDELDQDFRWYWSKFCLTPPEATLADIACQEERKVAQEEVEKYHQEEKLAVDKKLANLREELGVKFVNERRKEYLENELKKVSFLLKNKEEEEGLWKTFLGNFKKTQDPELQFLKRRYYTLYMEYGVLKNPDIIEQKNGFSEVEIERSRNVQIQVLLADRQMINAGSGRQKTRCPFHQEKTPSFTIFKNGIWHCFGCGAHGRNAIDFIMKRDKCNFKEAVKLLLNY